MAKRYFYTCPIKAIYMCKYFKMRFLGDAGQIVAIETREDHVDYMAETFKPHSPAYLGLYYIHPDCHALLLPQPGDIIVDDCGHPQLIEKLDDGTWCATRGGGGFNLACVEYIIQRDEKAFFTPQVEEV